MTKAWGMVASAVERWGSASQSRALANARVGAVECSRQAVERAEVALYLREAAVRTSYAAAE